MMELLIVNQKVRQILEPLGVVVHAENGPYMTTQEKPGSALPLCNSMRS